MINVPWQVKSKHNWFIKQPKASSYTIYRKQIESAYRDFLPLNTQFSFPKPLALLYMYDSAVNATKRFNGHWLTLDLLRKQYDNFAIASLALDEAKTDPALFISELFYQTAHGYFDGKYDKQLGVWLPDITKLDKAFQTFQYTVDHHYARATLLSDAAFNGWYQVYLQHYQKFTKQRWYDLYQVLKQRAYSKNDWGLIDELPSEAKNDSLARTYILTVYAGSDACNLGGAWLKWLQLVPLEKYENPLEMDLLATILGYKGSYDSE